MNDEKTPTVTDYSVSGNILSLTIEEGIDLTIKSNDLVIQYLGADCNNILITNNASPYTITCNLE